MGNSKTKCHTSNFNTSWILNLWFAICCTTNKNSKANSWHKAKLASLLQLLIVYAQAEVKATAILITTMKVLAQANNEEQSNKESNELDIFLRNIYSISDDASDIKEPVLYNNYIELSKDILISFEQYYIFII